jgi:hypothetical protein
VRSAARPQQLTGGPLTSARHGATDAMTQAVEARAVQLVDELNPQGIANVLWALASMQHQPGEHALTTLSSRAVGRLATRFNSQNLANVVCYPYHPCPP